MSLGALTLTNINLPMGMGMAGGKKDSGQSSGDDQKESSNTILKQIAANTATTVAILSTAVLGPPGETRDEDISEGETDPTDKPGLGDRFKGALSGVGSALSKVNPFSSNFAFGNFGKALLAGGGLLLLKQFGEGLIDPLANLLQTIKDAEIGKKLTEATNYMKNVGIETFEKIKTTTIQLIDGSKQVLGMIESAYKMVRDYVMSFDTSGAEHPAGPQFGTIDGGDGKLDADEQRALRDDIMKKASDFIVDMFKEITFGIGSLITQSAFLIAGANMGFAALKPILLGTGGAGVPGTVRKLGGSGYVAIGLMLANSILKTYQNIQSAMEDAVQDDGSVNYKQFAASFLGGEKEGSWRNAFVQSSRLGGTFSGIGIAIGAVGGPVGMLIGGVIGYFVGSVIGLITGKMGSDKIKGMLDKFGLMINDTVDVIGNFFTDLAIGFKAIASFKNPMAAIRENRATDPERLNQDVSRLTRQIEAQEKVVADSKATTYDPKNKKYLEINEKVLQKKIDKLNELKANLAEAEQLLVAAPLLASSTELENINQQISDNRLQLSMQPGKGTIGYDQDVVDELDEEFKILTDQRINLIKSITEIKNDMPLTELNKETETKKTLKEKSNSEDNGGVLVTADNSTKNSYNQQNTNVLDGLSFRDESTARLLGLEKEMLESR